MFSKSLTFRIIVLSGIWIIMALIGTGALLMGFYRDHIEQHYDAHVQMHMEEMVSAARRAGLTKLLFHCREPLLRKTVRWCEVPNPLYL